MTFWDRLEQVQTANDVLQHPFYVRWSAGELTAEELSFYAGEYRHAVVALAASSERVAALAEPALKPELLTHAREEADHIALWDGFASAVDAELDRAPLPETSRCAEAWRGDDDRSVLEGLVALYAIESAQPAISTTKLDGLRTHYGVTDSAATAYFELHRERDVEHAASGRALIEERLAGADEERLLASATHVLAANWDLLDGVQRRAS